MQLLHEYCQSKKRSNARYVHARAPEGRFRMRCILPDDKSSAKDLAFCPEQDFETMDDAKHCAALLALKHVDPLRPLERKLPDQYRELWLDLVKDVVPAGAAATTTSADKKPSRGKGKKGKEETKTVVMEEKKQTEVVKSEGDMDLWADTPDSPTHEDKSKTKRPVELTADRKFASRAEYEQAQLERAKHRNDRNRARENRERANPHKQVFMSAACREMIENVLKTLGVVSDGAAGESEGATQPTKENHEVFYAKVTKELSAIGFERKHIQGALQACKKDSDHSDDEFMTIILDWLCLHVPEGELPKGFNPEGTQLDVVVMSNGTDAQSTQTPLSTVLVQRLMKLGYDRRDAVTLVDEHVEANKSRLDVDNDAPTNAQVMQVVHSSLPHLLRHLALDTVVDAAKSAIPDEDELKQLREDELFALEAIYDDKMVMEFIDAGQLLTVHLTDEVDLEILLPSDSKYPFEYPALAVTCKDGSATPFKCLGACANALRSCQNSMGEPMIYDLCVAVESAISEKSGGERIVLFKREAKETASSPPPAPTVIAKDKPGNKKSKQPQRSASAKQPRKKQSVDPAQIKQMSDKLFQQRRAKDSNAGFQQMLQARAKLPAAAERDNVLEYIVHHQVVLVCGQTGCGKTTQIPQFIMDDYIDKQRGGECQIICTQPRRIAAIGVATRVAQERCEDIADIVGYQIRMDAKKSANTRLLFCTTGVLLRRLLTDRLLSGVSHVIVDEVHERNVDTDFLLSILRDLLPQRPDLRLILMSATMNAELFVNYFSSSAKSPCPVLDIPGFTYPVESHFLEDVIAKTSYQVPKKLLVNKKKASDAQDENAREKLVSEMTPQELVARIDDSRIDYELCVHLVKHLVESSSNQHGAILVFLPGTAEIKRLMEMLNQQKEVGSRLWVLALHGSLSGADQSLVFRPPPKGKTKVILSTNIAETSITINDITVVIDTGKVKEMVYDSQLRRSQLLDCWASRAACDQRKGRAGRVQAGTCYRLFSRDRFQRMDAQLAAEIHRVSLEQLCLQIKKLELGPIRAFLAKAIEPPKQEAIDSAMTELIAIAAFKRVEDDSGRQREEVRLTPLGSHLAMLPLDARIGKFLVYGSILRCIDPVATIAACISSKNPFVMSMGDPELQERQQSLKKELNAGSKSDHLLLARLIERYAPVKGQKQKRAFCKDYGLSYDTMETIVELKAQYLQQLDAIGFYEGNKRDELNTNSSFPRIVKAALCAGLYANVIQVVYPEQKYFQSAHGVFTEQHDAKKIRYFVCASTATGPESAQPSAASRERVFLHPSSCNFTQTQYDSPWLLYTELVQTSKVFVRESTMVNPYAMLLFGGKLEVVHEKNLLCLDDWIRFQAVARIGVLIKAIRRKLDELLTQKIANPEVDIAQSELVTAISHLLKSEGM
ncbi:hypothetical protein Poli38472_011618 [Pythium oligandrum]|uniref:RNA helicase n=1 Tax=Pythium oligandrum TaxID=41045 RepID=A0A8K1FNK9_PYTOL|nr:hypothetical protein Poli38472_011618 [Pythium oligandrum]|eukprot:TMW64738.1 hypothetical protein Poli38472_011618 [Pythium oligandrum]